MNRRHTPGQIRTVKKTTLIISLAVMLAFSFLVGVVGVARGLGSVHPQLNLVARPFVCGGDRLTYEQESSQVGGATYWTATWYCAYEDVAMEIDPSKVHIYSGVVYGVAILAGLLIVTYLYWNSSIGPAKNDGLRLW